MSTEPPKDPVEGQDENGATPPKRSVFVPTGAPRSFDRRYQNGKTMSVRENGKLKYRGVIRDARQRGNGTWEYLIHYEMSGTEEWVAETDLRPAR